MSDARLRLSDFLKELEAELRKASSQTEKYYHMDEVTLELDIAYTLTQPAEAPTKVKPEFWVLGRGSRNMEGSVMSQCNVQHLVLRLTPSLEDVQAGETLHIDRTSRPPEPQTSTN